MKTRSNMPGKPTLPKGLCEIRQSLRVLSNASERYTREASVWPTKLGCGYGESRARGWIFVPQCLGLAILMLVFGCDQAPRQSQVVIAVESPSGEAVAGAELCVPGPQCVRSDTSGRATLQLSKVPACWQLSCPANYRAAPGACASVKRQGRLWTFRCAPTSHSGMLVIRTRGPGRKLKLPGQARERLLEAAGIHRLPVALERGAVVEVGLSVPAPSKQSYRFQAMHGEGPGVLLLEEPLAPKRGRRRVIEQRPRRIASARL